MDLLTRYSRLETAVQGGGSSRGGRMLGELAQKAVADCRHGDLPRWLEVVSQLPVTGRLTELDQAMPALGEEAEDPESLAAQLMQLHPWRKGPLKLGGVEVDAEWRSDFKWDRLAPHMDLEGESILDVGSGNGYFGLRMLGAGARCVVGIDPTWLFVAQWLAITHFSRGLDHYVLPLKDSDLPGNGLSFDRVLSMGVLYHRRDPADHLQRLMACLRPGGSLVLETLVLDTPGDTVLVPEGRYARMRNVWFIPTIERMMAGLQRSGFKHVQAVDVCTTTTAEQRATGWMQFESLDLCLDPEDPKRTVEGHPAPVRAIFVASRP